MKNVRMNLEYLGTTVRDHDWKCNEYKATLKYGSKQLTTPFYTGIGWTSEPSSDDVLASLIMDAQSVEYESDFEGWASSQGYDTVSRKAEKTYNTCLKTATKLQNFLGNDYESFKKKYENY